MDHDSILMTIEEVAKYLNISISKCRVLARIDDFPVIQIGRAKLTNRKKLDAWVDKNMGKKIPINKNILQGRIERK